MINTGNKIHSFLHSEIAPGILLLFSAVVALLIANSPLSVFYNSVLQTNILGLSLQLWVNDGLMAIFFFYVGLEIKKELLVGHLSSPKKAALPVAAAIGGMVIPAALYAIFNYSDPVGIKGWGVPMATDIAFAIGLLTLFGKRVPTSLKVFLLAIAIVDDLGAILVIAFFYTSEIRGAGLGIAAGAIGVAMLFRYAGVRSFITYTIIGSVVWLGFLYSGVHATVAGVLLGLLTPLKYPVQKGSNNNFSPIEDLLTKLHPWTGFAIMPIFALANSGVNLRGVDLISIVSHPVHIGIVCGLFIGKPLGVLLFSALAYRFNLATLPQDLKWPQIFAVGCFAGIGFTMSLFISSLALPTELDVYAKVGIMTASILSGVVGSILFKFTLKKGIT